MANEGRRPPNPDRILDNIQVMLVPISIGASIILGRTQVPGLILIATHTFVSANLAVLVFRKVAGLLPPPK